MNRLQDLGAALLVVLMILLPLKLQAQPCPVFDSTWDGIDGIFSVATDQTGNVYVAEVLNNRILKFDGNGGYILEWGSQGSGEGQFSGAPIHVAASPLGYVYVVDSFYTFAPVQKFDESGHFISAWGTHGSEDGQFEVAWGVATDPSGNVFVGDIGRVQKFDSDGNYLTSWGEEGSGPGQFESIVVGLAVDQSGNVFAACGGRIQKFDSDGSYLLEWGSPGSGPGQFEHMDEIDVDADGNVLACDQTRFQVFDAFGNFLCAVGESGSGDGQFINCLGIAADGSGNVFAGDLINQRIQKFGPAITSVQRITWGALKAQYRQR